MKRFLLFPCFLCLALGLLLGVLLPVNWPGRTPAMTPGTLTPPVGEGSGAASSPSSSAEKKPLDTRDNFTLLNAACTVNAALREKNYAAVASFVHPELRVTFTPYSTVDPDTDLTFSAEQIRNLAQDDTVYTWGVEDGRGEPIQMTMEQYFARYVYDTDYTQVPEIGVDRIMTGGNALENLAEAYPQGRFVDFSFPSADPELDGLDWSSLKLVFQGGEDRWYLVGIVHGEWTI